ncbi:MAG: LPS export ABC transporter periplasmic protein LptC [Ferruginibacter sp.]
MSICSANIKLFAAFLAGCFFLVGCENDLNKIKEFDAKKTGVEVAKKVAVNYSINGKRKALLISPLMYRVQDTVPYVEFPQTIHVDFFNEKNSDSVESKLDARYAKYKETQSKVFLKDSVRVINVLGDTLYCDELYWDMKRTGTEFYTDKPVRVRTRTQIINGIGMEARQDFKEWHIIQSTGILKVPASQFPD